MVIQINSQKIRFVAVGIINTMLDFVIYTIALSFGISPILANYISTTIALSFSFFANKKYTFQSSGKVRSREILSFLVVTLVGLWILQPVIIKAITSTSLLQQESLIQAIVAKLLATIVSLVWNYVLYDKLVFKDKHSTSDN